MKCQILTRGLIPGIMIRGPVANIELAFDTICDLLDRGVNVRREDGSPFDRVSLDEKPKKETVVVVPAEKKYKLPEPPELYGHPDPVGHPGQPGMVDATVEVSIPGTPVIKEDPREAEVHNDVVHEIVKQSDDVITEHQKAAFAADADASPDDLDNDEDDESDGTPAQANTDPANPYAGMSKNQAKKARRAAAAKAAAEAAAKSGNSTPQ